MQPVFRFAPSPNGALHLGHALSAILNFEAAKELGGRFLLRMEDIDIQRCTPEKKMQMLDDLAWLGLEWEEPVLYQSCQFERYQAALSLLRQKGLVYPSRASRKQIQNAIAEEVERVGEGWPRDPDGAFIYPRHLLKDHEIEGPDSAWRLDSIAALQLIAEPLVWSESGPLATDFPAPSPIKADPTLWGDVILARKDYPTSYHLSVVLDDAEQGITHVVRGQDLYQSTALHRLLQQLLGLPAPIYHHHRLLVGPDGDKLSKSKQDLSLKALREDGITPEQIRNRIKFDDTDLIGLLPDPNS